MSEQLTEYLSDGIRLLEHERDTLRAEAEALRAENGRLQSACDHNKNGVQVFSDLADELSLELEAARGLLESAVVLFACHCTDATAKNWHDAAAAFLTATPAPESAPYGGCPRNGRRQLPWRQHIADQ